MAPPWGRSGQCDTYYFAAACLVLSSTVIAVVTMPAMSVALAGTMSVLLVLARLPNAVPLTPFNYATLCILFAKSRPDVWGGSGFLSL